ncbi:220_t:CDS:2 [Entrophospora sp. SA101]|nr:220_t:CDS:2 [Entrophospora sp. SA101]
MTLYVIDPVVALLSVTTSFIEDIETRLYLKRVKAEVNLDDGESEDDESDNHSGYIDVNNDHDDNDLEFAI